MKVYLTKYALTEGIQEIDVEKDGDFYSKRINSYSHINYLARDVCLTLEEARRKANNIRVDRINKLNAEIDMLKKLNFFE